MRVRLVLALVLALGGCGGGDATRETEAPTTPPPAEEAPDRAPAEDGAPFHVEADFAFLPAPGSDTVMRFTSRRSETCAVFVEWWRPYPPEPGGVMTVASRRPVHVLGEDRELLTTSWFEGEEEVVGVLMIPGDGVHTRVHFEGCAVHEQDAFLAALGEATPEARALREARAFALAQGYLDAAPSVPDDQIVREGIEGAIEDRRGTLVAEPVQATRSGEGWMVDFRYRDPQHAGRGRALVLSPDAPPRFVHQDRVLP